MVNLIKKVSAVILSVTMLFCSSVICASAAEINCYVSGSEVISLDKSGIADEIIGGEYNGSYYNALSVAQKDIYDALRDKYLDDFNMPKNDTTSAEYSVSPQGGVNASYIDKFREDIKYAYFAFYYDFPEFFWSNGYSWSAAYNSRTLNVTINPLSAYDGAEAEITEYREKVQEAVQEVYNSVKKDYSAYDYYLAAHDWICNHVDYCFDVTEDPAYDYVYSNGPLFIRNSDSVCQGYSEAFKVICDQLRIRYGNYGTAELENALVYGVADEGPHQWNCVKMPDGKWYSVDVTWDDQETEIYDTYFLCGKYDTGFTGETFENEHYLLPDFYNFPEIADHSYAISNCSVKYIYKDKNTGAEKSYNSTVKKYGYTAAENLASYDLQYDTSEWYTDRTCKNQYNYNARVDSDVTLYAGFRKAAKLYGCSIALGDNIAVDLYVDIDKRQFGENAYVDLVTNSENYSAQYIKNARMSGDYYVFRCVLSAKELCDSIGISINDNGKVINLGTYSAKKYAETFFAEQQKYSDNEVALVKALLNYGAAAQMYFDYKTSELANQILSSEDREIAKTDFVGWEKSITGTAQGLTYYGSTLTLDDYIKVKHYFILADGYSASDYEVVFTDENGAKYKTQLKENDGFLVVEVSHISAKHINDWQNLEIRLVGDNSGCDVHYSPYSYCYDAVKSGKTTGIIDVSYALFAYGYASHKYAYGS